MTLAGTGTGSLRVLVVVSLVAALASCGGGGGAGAGVLPGGEIAFPISGMNFESSTVTVHGRGSAGADQVLVNGMAATSSDGFATWSATLTLEPGTNSIDVEVVKGGASQVLDRRDVHHGPEIIYVDGCSDVKNSEFLMCAGDRLFRVDAQDGSRVELDLPLAGHVDRAEQIIWDRGRNRALLYNGFALDGIDLADGSDHLIPVPSAVNQPVVQIAYDSLNDDCFLLRLGDAGSGQAATIFRVPTLTLAGPTIHSSFAGLAGDPDEYLVAIDFDEVSGRLFAWSAISRSLFEINGDGSRSLLDAPGPAGPSIGPASPLAFRVLPGGDTAVIVTTSSQMLVIDLQSGTRSLQPIVGLEDDLPLPALDEQGRFLVFRRHGYPQWDVLGIGTLDPVTLALDTMISFVPGRLPAPTASGQLLIGGIDFDHARRRLVIAAEELIYRVDPMTGDLGAPVGQFASPIPGWGGGLVVDETRDRLISTYRSNVTGAPHGIYEFDSLGGNPSLLIPMAPYLPFGGNDMIVHADSTGEIFVLHYLVPIPPAPFDMTISRHDADGVLLGQTSIPLVDYQMGVPVHHPLDGRLYNAVASGNNGTYVAAVDPVTGTAQLVSPILSDGIGIGYPAVGCYSERTGELFFADSRNLIAVDPQTGARRLVAQYPQLGYFLAGTPALDQESGVVYLGVRSSEITGILAIDTATGALGFIAR